jgi:hypothetical protein
VLADLLRKRAKAEEALSIIRQDIRAVKVRLREDRKEARRQDRIVNGPKGLKQTMREAEERRRKAMALRSEGLTYAEVGRRMGISGHRARQMVLIQEYRDDPEKVHQERWGWPAPGEGWRKPMAPEETQAAIERVRSAAKAGHE